jgi:hypothetical protein
MIKLCNKKQNEVGRHSDLNLGSYNYVFESHWCLALWAKKKAFFFYKKINQIKKNLKYKNKFKIKIN